MGFTVSVIAITKGGSRLAAKLASGLARHSIDVEVYTPPRFGPVQDPSVACHTFEEPLRDLVGRLTGRPRTKQRGLVFIMATGAVVRLMAPFLVDKATDPAVVVVDETGRWAISLLSGHLGGANELAYIVAQSIGAQAVITTASDVRGLLAFDVLARQQGWTIEPLEGIRTVQAALLNGETVSVYSELDVNRLRCLLEHQGYDLNGLDLFPLGKGLTMAPNCPSVFITSRIMNTPPGSPALLLRPRNLVVGVGCRRGVSQDGILQAINTALEVAGRSVSGVKALATVDFRAEEPGIKGAAEMLGVPVKAASRQAIDEAEREGRFKASAVVRHKVGVGGVSEPSALLGGEQTRLILPKTVVPGVRGVTVAIAIEEGGF